MAGIQQILLGMGGAAGDSYWFNRLNYGSQTGSYDHQQYYCTNGSTDDDNDDIFVAGNRSYYRDGVNNRWQAIYLRLDTEGAIQAQINFATAGSYASTAGTGCIVQKYSDQNYQSGAEQKYVLIGGSDNKHQFARCNVSNLAVQGQDSFRTGEQPQDYYNSMVAPKRGFRWSGGSGGGVNNETLSCFYFGGRIIGKIAFSSNPSSSYNSNNAASQYNPATRRIISVSFYGSTYYQSPIIRGIDFEPGSNSYDPSDNQWDNVAPFIYSVSSYNNVTNQTAQMGYRCHIQRNRGYGTFGQAAKGGGNYDGWRQSKSTFTDGAGVGMFGGGSGTRCDTSYSYHCGHHNNNANTQIRGWVMKWDGDGTVSWTKEVTDNGGEEDGNQKVRLRAIELDDDGCTYVVGYSEVSSTRKKGIIMKFNANGTVAWQNVFYKTSSNANSVVDFRGIKRNQLGTLIIYGWLRDDTQASPGTSSTQAEHPQGVIMKVAPDGSGTGTVGDYTYAASSFGVGNMGNTWADLNNSAGNYQSNYISIQRNYGENKDNNFTMASAVTTTTM
tara:strand:+ start:184 stop:1842 length:1659 start_codon:yes stop_codon:yes gene_type:complete